MIKISASTNPEKEENLVDYVKMLEQLNVDYLHCDVMDGKFVKNTCLSHELLFDISQHSTIALDVHLMVSNPIQVLENYLLSKPMNITVHYESFNNKDNLLFCLTKIKKHNIMAGISIKPNTDWQVLKPYLALTDMILIMSVEPGESGQKFMESTLKKVYDLKGYIEANKLNVKVQVDGGVNLDNIKVLEHNGCDIAVVGSALYKANNKEEFVKQFKEI